MKISELYNEKFTLSFEVFPPKTEKGEINLINEIITLSKHNPGFISVTYGAGGTTREKTLNIALKIKNDLNLTPLVHFTCVGMNRNEIKSFIKEIKEKGIENILALRGDPPEGDDKFTPPVDGFSYANKLIEYISSIDQFTIAAAAYPEGHLEAPDFETDMDNLKRKVDSGADLLITQLFYNNNAYYKFIDAIEKRQIKIPVVPGIMPVTSLAQVEKIVGMCGAKIPEKLLTQLSSCDINEALCNAAIEYTVEQCTELKEWGVKGFHFYTMNKSAIVGRIIKALKL